MAQTLIEPVEVAGVSSTTCSVLATNGARPHAPAVLVHGIFDSVQRWLTPSEVRRWSLAIPDHPSLLPNFDCEPRSRSVLGFFPRVVEGSGLLSRLADEGLPVAAFSYQDHATLVQDMSVAVECLHRVVDWARQRWSTPRVQLLGHSRGGLVCRHALLTNSAVMTAAEFQSSVSRLVTLCTPHQGSRIASVLGPMQLALDRIKPVVERARHTHTAFARFSFDAAARFQSFLFNLSELRPTAEEVTAVCSLSMPGLPGGYVAIAGTSPAYFRCEVPVLGQLCLPPTLPIPELTDGTGDLAVSVESAFDIPNPTSDRLFTFPANHLSVTRDARVHELVVRLLKS